MKVFEKDGKINFVDDKNVFVGFDYSQGCCENFGYIISKKLPDSLELAPESLKDSELEGFNFNTKFFKECPMIDCDSVSFKASKNRKTLYITLYNCHNGYYGHGFEANINGLKWQEGTL
jgi:hypothetical protein